MKIKLIIILFGISCLFFPAELMEAEAGLGSIIKGIAKPALKVGKGMRGAGDDVAKGAKGLVDDPHIKPLKEVGDMFKEYFGLKQVGSQTKNLGGDISAEIKNTAQRYKMAQQAESEEDIGDSQEPNEIRFKELSDEKYRYNISTPEFWPPYNAKEYLVSLDPGYETYNEIILFTDEPDRFTSTDAGWYAGGFILYIEELPEEIPEIPTNAEEEIENSLRETCNETPTTCSDFQMIESEVTGEAPYMQIKLKYSMKTRAGTDSQFIAVIEQVKVVSSDDFVYTLHFGNEKNKFAAYAILYDHIEDSFFVDEPPDYFTTILITGLAGLGVIIPFVARRLRKKTQKKKKR